MEGTVTPWINAGLTEGIRLLASILYIVISKQGPLINARIKTKKNTDMIMLLPAYEAGIEN